MNNNVNHSVLHCGSACAFVLVAYDICHNFFFCHGSKYLSEGSCEGIIVLSPNGKTSWYYLWLHIDSPCEFFVLAYKLDHLLLFLDWIQFLLLVEGIIYFVVSGARGKKDVMRIIFGYIYRFSL